MQLERVKKTIHTVCSRDCYDVCSLVVTVDENQVIQTIQGDTEHPVTAGRLCPRSAKDAQRLYKNRIDTPWVKTNHRHARAGWPQALDKVSLKLLETIERYGPESVLFLNYAGNTGLFANAFPHRLWNALGATQTDGALCSQSGHLGLALHYGLSYGLDPADMPQKGLIVFWGFNPAVSAPHLWRLAVNAQRKGTARIIAIDPIETRTAQNADLWLRPRPATDTPLAYGIMSQLIDTGEIDMEFLGEWTSGFDALKKEADRWPLERVESVTGIRRDVICQAAHLYAAVRPSATMIGYGLQHCTGGADQTRAVSMIPALLGMHRGFFYGNGSAYDIDTARIKGRSLTEKTPKIIRQVAVADHVNSAEFKFIYVSCMNPALTLPNQRAFRSGIQRDDVFLAVHDTHWTQTAEYADVVLPAPAFLEKDDIVIPDSHRLVSLSRRAVPPSAQSRHEIWVMRQLAKRLKRQEEWLYEDERQAVSQALSHAFESNRIEDLFSGKRLMLKRRALNEYQTSSGKIEFYSRKAASMGWAPLPRFRPVPPASLPYTYITSSIAEYTHTQFQDIYGPIPPIVHIHPADAAREGIDQGNAIFLYNDSGKIQLEARISDRIPPGTVWSPKELAGLDGSAQNCLTSSLPQTIGDGPRFNSTRVGMSKHDRDLHGLRS